MSTTSNAYIQSQPPQNVKPGNKEEPGYVQQATDLLSSATATVSSYLPTSVTGAVSNVTGTDTTKMYRNKQPHVGGVGDLGTDSAQDVTRLPEERQNPDPFNKQAMGVYGVGGHPGCHGGVGDLGTDSVTDVVRLPEERAHPDPFSESLSTNQNVAMLPQERSSHDPTTTGTNLPGGLGGHDGRHHDISKLGSMGGHTGANYDVDHGLGMPHTRSVEPTKDDDRLDRIGTESSGTRPVERGTYGSDSQTMPTTDDGHKTTSQSQDNTGTSTSDEYQPPKVAGYPTGKPSLMDKVKGAAIIAKAKIGSGGADQEKIHQGTMLKETGKKVNPEEDARRASMDG